MNLNSFIDWKVNHSCKEDNFVAHNSSFNLEGNTLISSILDFCLGIRNKTVIVSFFSSFSCFCLQVLTLNSDSFWLGGRQESKNCAHVIFARSEWGLVL